jgi:hypothetical protein
MLEPGMLAENAPWPANQLEAQARFRRAVAGTRLAKLLFVPESELLLRARDLVPMVNDLARIRAADVSTIGEAELAGGYAFLDGAESQYVFGVEDDSTLLGTAQWDASIAELMTNGKARVRHACDHFILAEREKDMVVLTHERSGRQYRADFARFKNCIGQASDELHRFALAFVPAYERELARRLAPDHARRAAVDSFRDRPGWFVVPS